LARAATRDQEHAKAAMEALAKLPTVVAQRTRLPASVEKDAHELDRVSTR
jgi:hypothetical protein